MRVTFGQQLYDIPIYTDTYLKNVSLYEKTVQEIKTSPIHDLQELFYNRDRTYSMFKLLYEVEYKYNVLKTNRFTGVERRRQNILTILEEVGHKVSSALAEAFEIVFEEWLSAHAITEPQKWAEARLSDFFEEYDYRMIMELITMELSRYLGRDNVVYDYYIEMFQNVVDGQMPDMPEVESFLNTFGPDTMIESAEIALEDVSAGYMDLQDWGQMYGIDADSVEEASEKLSDINTDRFWELNEVSDIYPFTEGLGSFSDTVEDYFRQVGEHRAWKFFLEIEEHVVFPIWFDHWNSRGIKKTRKTIEDIHDLLKGIDRLPIEKKFLVLNLAKNVNHQTGSMMEYFEEKFEVDKRMLDALSDQDTSEWDRELEEIGVIF